MNESIRMGNFGVLTDAALTKHKHIFAQQAAFAGLINGIFAAISLIFGWIFFAVIWPFIPNFTNNQTITDGIILGIFSILMLLIVAFFLAWQSAAIIVVCKHHGQGNMDLSAVIKEVARSSLPSVMVLFAQILLFVPFLAAFAFIAAFNLSSIPNVVPPLLFVLFLILIILRTSSFFAVNLSVEGKHHFLAAVIHSCRMVIQKGAARIFAVTALITTINIGLFFGLFLFFLVIFGQLPADLLGFFVILANPMGVAALLFLAYLITIFVTPKIQILAYTLYHSGDAIKEHNRPGLASRSLATALDIAIVAVVFSVCFRGAFWLVSGGSSAMRQMNIFAVIIAIIAFFAVYTIYNIFFEAFGGQTPAKYIFGLIVRSQDGASVNLVQSLVRNILRIVDIFGFVAILYNKEHRRLGDLLSLSMVEYKKEGDSADVS